MASYGARGSAAAWLGEALMRMAQENRDKEMRQGMLARDDQRFNAEQAFRASQFDYAKQRDSAADERAALERQAAASEAARQREVAFREKGGVMGTMPGGTTVPMGYDPTRSLEYKQLGANLKLRKQFEPPPAPREPVPQFQPTSDGRAFNRFTGEFKGEPKPKDNSANSNIDNALTTLETLAANPSPAGDVAFGYAFIKLLDPTSVVREGELALLGKAKSLRTGMEQQIARIRTGEQLTPQQRQDYLEQARAIVAARKAAQQGDSGLSSGMTDDDPLADYDSNWRSRR
jgi:hypothetical protein